jgi:hypothetical protein
MTIVKDNSRVVNKLEASLNEDARAIIYDRHMFIVQATEYNITLLIATQPKPLNQTKPTCNETLSIH